jgi:hypothetical protein
MPLSIDVAELATCRAEGDQEDMVSWHSHGLGSVSPFRER